MTRITAALTWLKSSLPDLGIFAFALASTWALYQLFNNSARHPTILYIAPAALVEIVTAWLMKNATSAAYQFTRSRITKQDRRFHLIILSACLVLAAPTIVASTLANGYEFNGSVWLALLFPAASVGCAVGGAIPRTIARHERGKTDESRAELKAARAQSAQLRQYLDELNEARAMEAQLLNEMTKLQSSVEAWQLLGPGEQARLIAMCSNGDRPAVQDVADALECHRSTVQRGYEKVEAE